MTRSLLSRLPDIFACAAVRSNEAMHALGLRPGQCVASVTTASEDGAAPSWRLHRASDMSALLSMLAGQAPFLPMRKRLGLLWLSTQPVQGISALAGEQEAWQKRDVALLSDFAQRLLLARELLSPSALVVVESAAGLEEGISFVMQTIFGQRPQWMKIDERPDAPLVLMCPVGAAHSAWSAGRRHSQINRTNLLQWMSEGPKDYLTALALSPHLDLNEVWRAWRGRWVVTHADPVAFERLELRSAELHRA